MIYEFNKVLGSGHFGKVKLATHKITNDKVAIKILIKNEKRTRSIKNEITIMQKLSSPRILEGHKNIILLHETIETPTSTLLVMDYMEGGDLFDYVCENGKLTESKSKHFFKQIVSALSFCHFNSVVHRDLKLENILLDNNDNIKLADFGLSEIVEDGQYLKTQCGSPKYSAPEIVNGNLYIGQEIDIWSLGICLYILLNGYYPFDDLDMDKVYIKINLGKFTVEPGVPEQAEDLMKKIIQIDATKRLKLSEIKKHEWLSNLST